VSEKNYEDCHVNSIVMWIGLPSLRFMWAIYSNLVWLYFSRSWKHGKSYSLFLSVSTGSLRSKPIPRIWQ